MKEFFRKKRKHLVFDLVSKGIRLPRPILEKYLEILALHDLLSGLDINCVLDVGANVGQFASDLRMVGFKGQIISFEPVKSSFQILSNAMANDDSWFGYQIALGKDSATKLINVGEETVMSSILEFNQGLPSSGKEEIKVERLDKIWNELDFGTSEPRVFLKIDTQGFDGEVFDGASGCIGSILGLLSEISVIPLYKGMRGYKSSLEQYEGAGFKLSNLSCVARTEKAEIVEMNCIMRR